MWTDDPQRSCKEWLVCRCGRECGGALVWFEGFAWCEVVERNPQESSWKALLAAGTLVATSCLPLNSHPHSLKLMCNLCGKCRLNKQSKDSFVSTRVWFVFLHVCSHVALVQLREFRPGSFCLFQSRVWNSDILMFISFLFSPSPYLQGGDRNKVQIFVFPGLTRFHIVLRALSLFSCLTALATLKYRKITQGHSSEKQNCHQLGCWREESHMAEGWQWEGMWGAEVSEAVLPLPRCKRSVLQDSFCTSFAHQDQRLG